MIRPTLPTRYNKENSIFTIHEISLMNRQGDNCGIVSYVRMDKDQDDTLDMLIFESIKFNYPLSLRNKTRYFTNQTSPAQLSLYTNRARLFIAVKNYTKFDPAYAIGHINSGLAIFLDIYNPNEGVVYDEINYYAREKHEEFANACDEEYNNLETYNTFLLPEKI